MVPVGKVWPPRLWGRIRFHCGTIVNAAFGNNGLFASLILDELNPNTEYLFTFQSFDWAVFDGQYSHLFDAVDHRVAPDVAAGGLTNGSTAFAYSSNLVDSSYSITDFSSPSGSSGSFIIRSNSSGWPAPGLGDVNGIFGRQVNSFELGAATTVPEPASTTRLSIGTIGMAIATGLQDKSTRGHDRHRRHSSCVAVVIDRKRKMR